MSNSDPTVALRRSPDELTLLGYQQLAKLTDRSALSRRTSFDFPLLGLVGEVGSLVAEVKKKQRDADSYTGYEPAVLEELGDTLWYFAILATRADLTLPELAAYSESPVTRAIEVADRPFQALQPVFAARGPRPPDAFEAELLRLAGRVGLVVTEVSGRTAPDRGLIAPLASVFHSLIAVANGAGVRLGDAAHRNLQKTFGRWPVTRDYTPLFDEDFPPNEKLPRYVELEISEELIDGRLCAVQRYKGTNLGDPLTDNKKEEDDYRFHDAFHLAYAAVLGWSPNLRCLFRAKRKSVPRVDEAEDGARAILIEEGIATWIFNHATRLNFFENLNTIDYGLLKAVRNFIDGYEVDRCPLWMWEEAILKGYAVFRQLRQHRRGRVIADLIQRTIAFQEMPNDAGSACGCP
jgi:NTP pyrophosphatase (non-canonical NTP hydrolase)